MTAPPLVRASFFGILSAAAMAPTGIAQVVTLDVSNEVAWTSGATVVDDDGIRRIVPPSTATALDVGTVPASSDLIAYHVLDDGRRVFALDTFVDLGGGVAVGPEDLAVWNGSSHAVFLDGSAIGVPAGAAIDAVAHRRLAGVSSTLLSFDVTVALPGGFTADDEDVVGWNGSVWSMSFDGSANGVPAELDVDGFDSDPVDGVLFFSFDTSGTIGGVDFDDEDVVAFDGTSWSLADDASANLDPTFAGGDLDALGVRTVNIFRDGFEAGSPIEWSAAVP